MFLTLYAATHQCIMTNIQNCVTFFGVFFFNLKLANYHKAHIKTKIKSKIKKFYYRLICIISYFISIFIFLTCRKVVEALKHRVSNYPDLLPEISFLEQFFIDHMPLLTPTTVISCEHSLCLK